MVKKMVWLVLSLVFVLGVSPVFAQGETEVDHETELEHCPGGGKLFIGNVGTTNPTAAQMGTFSMDIRSENCVPQVDVQGAAEDKEVSDTLHASGEFALNPDGTLQIRNSVASRQGTRVTSAAGDDFMLSCTQVVNGRQDDAAKVFDGDIMTICTRSGKMKKDTVGLLQDALPHF